MIKSIQSNQNPPMERQTLSFLTEFANRENIFRKFDGFFYYKMPWVVKELKENQLIVEGGRIYESLRIFLPRM